MAAGLLVLAAMVAVPTGAAAGPPDLNGQGLQETDRAGADKGVTSRMAQSDPAVVGADGSEPTRVLVKLDYDAVAAYTGGLARLAPTSPSVTGRTLADGGGAAVEDYDSHVAGVEDAFLKQLAAEVPQAQVRATLRTVYGGVALSLPADRAGDLLALPGVLAVQADTLNQLLTDSSGEFLGAPTLYSALGSSSTAGSGTVVGVLDSGVWPEHPSFADPAETAAPGRSDGTARPCEFGDNPLTPQADPFTCTGKLISGEAFLDTYNATFGDELYPDSARDSDGHGTHTASTAAGAPVAVADLFGVNRGPVAGIAPGARIAAYKVCGAQGCFASDAVAAVQQAVRDGVDVINFSISGGTAPFTDPVELAFLDAYRAGVFVAASAGNEGPTAGTVNHLSPWVTTVAASTQAREFRSILTLTAGADSLTLTGASVTGGVDTATPVVLADAAPYGDPTCSSPAAAGLLSGKVVACRRGGNGRVAKGHNVSAGGAAGMILYNPTPADTETDNHWLPTVHLADGAEFLAFLAAHPAVTASFTAGRRATGTGDVMADFSSRGPGGSWLKPDVTAPGVQILAGHTPTPDSTDAGPPGQYFQAVAGTSMSAPQVAGAAALLAALHPDWTPGMIKSALLTTATTAVLKQDGVTAADPFDLGSGRIDLSRAGDPGLTFDVAGSQFEAADQTGPRDGIDLNVPSVNVRVLAGEISTTRVATNVTDRPLRYSVSSTGPDGARIAVTPSAFTVAPGKSVTLTIKINGARLQRGQYFGRITLDELGGPRDVHLPVAFTVAQGAITLTSQCTPAAITLQPRTESTCTVRATNTGAPTSVTVTSTLSERLRLSAVTVSPPGLIQGKGPGQDQRTRVGVKDVALAGAKAGTVSVAPGSLFGYLSLTRFGVTATAIGDEQIVNYDVPAFQYGGRTNTRIGVTSNGYVVVGGGTAADVLYEPQLLPNPELPNNVLAPFWADLDGTGAPGILVGTLTDGTHSWLVVEWQVYLYGTDELNVFQTWIGTDGAEDITFAYDPDDLPTGVLYTVTVGAENQDGSSGAQLPGLPTEDLRVRSSPGAAGGSVSYAFTVRGLGTGDAVVETSLTSPATPGWTIVRSPVTVSR